MRWSIFYISISLIILGILGGFMLNKSSIMGSYSKISNDSSFNEYDFNLDSTKGDYEIINNSVITNDSRVMINITPHTISGNEPLYIEFESKQFNGDIDVVFFSNSDKLKPKRIYYYNPYNITKEESFICDDGYYDLRATEYNMVVYPTSFNYTLNPNYGMCFRNISYPIGGGKFSNQTFILWEGRFNRGNLTTKTIYWNESQEFLWRDVTTTPQRKDTELLGVNKFFYYKDFKVVAGENYKFKVELNVPINVKDSKFYFGIKRSQDTLQEAVDNGRFYFIDPWYSTNFSKRINLTLGGTVGITENLTDFPILVRLNSTRIDYSDTNDDGSDIRFVGEDESTILSHDIDTWNESGESFIWVKLPKVNASVTSQKFYMYYKNTTPVSDGQNINDVWSNNFTAVYHLGEDPTGTAPQYIDKTGNGNDGNATNLNSADVNTTMLGRAISPDSTSGNEGINFSSSTSTGKINQNYTEYYIEAFINPTTSGTTMHIGFQNPNSSGGTGNSMRKQGASSLRSYAKNSTHSISNTGNSVNANNWTYVASNYNTTHIRVEINGTLRVFSAFTGIAIPNGVIPTIAYGVYDNLDFRGFITEVRLSNVTRSENWTMFSKRAGFDEILNYSASENAPTTDSCTYSSGNWAVSCSDNCSINSNVDLGGNNISIIGFGNFTLSDANITNWRKVNIQGVSSSNMCSVRIQNNGGLKR